jgi:hypothetical protein
MRQQREQEDGLLLFFTQEADTVQEYDLKARLLFIKAHQILDLLNRVSWALHVQEYGDDSIIEQRSNLQDLINELNENPAEFIKRFGLDLGVKMLERMPENMRLRAIIEELKEEGLVPEGITENSLQYIYEQEG